MRAYTLSVSLILAILLACAGALLIAPMKPAEAAFPGKNGDIAFSSNVIWTGNSDVIYTMNRDGTGSRRFLNFWEYNLHPAWSPNGTRLAADTTTEYACCSDIVLVNADGTNPVNVTDSEDFHESDPAFFPSERRLVFCGGSTEAGPGLYARSFDQTGHATGPMKRLTFSASDCEPSVSPDGKKIAFVRNGGIFVMRSGTPAGSDNVPVRLTGRSVFASHPDWSPDGRRIVYERAGDNWMDNDIWTMNPDGGGKKEIGPGWGPAFSPDGRMIAFLFFNDSAPEGGMGIWKMRVDGTGRTLLSPDVDPNGQPWAPYGPPSWQPLP